MISLPSFRATPPQAKPALLLRPSLGPRFQGDLYRFNLDQPEIRLVGKLESFTAPGGYRMQVPTLCWNEESNSIQLRYYFYKESDPSKSLANSYDYVATPTHGTVFANEFGEMVIVDQQEKKLRFRDGSWMDAVTGDLYSPQNTLMFSKTRSLPDTKPM